MIFVRTCPSNAPPASPVMVDPPKAVAMRERKRFVEFRRRDRPVQSGIVVGAIAGTVLVHQVEIGVARNLLGEETASPLLPGDPVGQHEMPHQQAPSRKAVLIDLEIADLAVHLADRRLVHPQIVADMRVPMRELRIAVFHVGHVDVDDAVQQRERLQGVVAAGVVDQRQPQALGRRQIDRVEDLGTTWLGVTKLMLWQPISCNRSIMAASSSVETSRPSPPQLMSQFWQKTQRRLQNEKKIVPEPFVPRRQSSSP